MHETVSSHSGKRREKPSPAWAENDKFLRSRNLKHLLFDRLATREERIFRELSALRRDLQTTKFVRISDHGGVVQMKRRVFDPVRQGVVRAVSYVSAPSEFSTTIDMAPEYEARRRERRLSRELAEIDALWLERDAVLSASQSGKGKMH